MKKADAAAENLFMSKCCACGLLLNNPFLCVVCSTVQPFQALTPFELLAIAPDFPLNQLEVQKHYLDRQRLVHPDQCAGGEKWSEALNQAYQTLKDPLRTLQAVLEVHGYVLDPTIHDPVVLAEAFELQEEIADASYERLCTTILPQLKAKLQDMLEQAYGLYEDQRFEELQRLFLRMYQLEAVLKQLKNRC